MLRTRLRTSHNDFTVMPSWCVVREVSCGRVRDRLAALYRHLVQRPQSNKVELLQVVSSSFEELVLDPNTGVIVLFFNESHRAGDIFSHQTLLAPLLVNLTAICHLLYSLRAQSRSSPSQEDRKEEDESKHKAIEELRLPRFAVMDCMQHHNELSVDWLPTSCYLYWGALSSSAVVGYPALPKTGLVFVHRVRPSSAAAIRLGLELVWSYQAELLRSPTLLQFITTYKTCTRFDWHRWQAETTQLSRVVG